MAHVTAPDVVARRQQRLAVALVANVLLVAGELVAGAIASSLGLVADGVHNLTDVVGVALALVAVRYSTRAATAQRTFGYHRATILAASANAVLLLGATTWLVIEAVRRLISPVSVTGWIVLVVSLVGAGINAGSARLLHEHVAEGPGDLNMRAATVHLAADAVASVAVAVAGLVILLTGRLFRLDPVATLVVGCFIAVQAWRLLRESGDVLLESTPAHLDLDRLAATMAQVTGVQEVHDVHAWSLSSEVHALSAHVVVTGHPTLEEAQQVGDRVKASLAPYRIRHATIELECEACGPVENDPCALVEEG